MAKQVQVKKLNNWIENIKSKDSCLSKCITCNKMPFNIFGTMTDKSKKKTDPYCIECLLQKVQKQARKKKLIPCSIKYYYYNKDLVAILEKFKEVVCSNEMNEDMEEVMEKEMELVNGKYCYRLWIELNLRANGIHACSISNHAQNLIARSLHIQFIYFSFS